MNIAKRNSFMRLQREIKEAIIKETVKRNILAEKSLFNEFDDDEIEFQKIKLCQIVN